jgi:hypothetical protein
VGLVVVLLLLLVPRQLMTKLAGTSLSHLVLELLAKAVKVVQCH